MLEKSDELKAAMTKLLEEQDFDIFAKIMENNLQIQEKLKSLENELQNLKIKVEKLGDKNA